LVLKYLKLMEKNRFEIIRTDVMNIDNNCIWVSTYISNIMITTRYINNNLFGIRIRKNYGRE